MLTCDFCGEVTTDSPDRMYRLPPGVTLTMKLEDGTDYIDDGEFLACPGCKELINRQAWDRLTQRISLLILKQQPRAAIERFGTPEKLLTAAGKMLTIWRRLLRLDHKQSA